MSKMAAEKIHALACNENALILRVGPQQPESSHLKALAWARFMCH